MSQRIHLDATPGLFHQVLHCHQGDVGRQFEIAVVTRDGYEIPSGATFKIQATKPSGLGFTVTGTAANNIISFTSTEDMTSEAGEIPTQLEIKSGNDVIYTSNFLLVCETNVHPSSVTDGSPEEIISEITLLVERAESAASTAGADAAAAAQARVDEMMDYLPSEVADLKSELSEVQNVLDIYVPPTASGTTPADNNANPVLTGLSLIKGHSYKYEVEYETPSDATSYLSWWMTGGSSYSGLVTINAGTSSAYGTINNVAINVPSAYLALTTNGRQLKYKVKITDLSITTNRLDEIESSIESNAEKTEQLIDGVNNTIGVYKPPSSTGTKAANSGNSTIIDNLTVVENRLYRIDLTIDPLDVASYVNLWDGTSQSYSRIWTISAGTTDYATYEFAAGFSSETALIKLDTQGRATSYSVQLVDISEQNLNYIEANAQEINALQKVTESKQYNSPIDEDVTGECEYTLDRATLANGETLASSGYCYTSKIKVEAGDIVYKGGYQTAYFSRITAYENGTAKPSLVAENVLRYVVPSGVNEIVISMLSSYNREYGTIYIKRYSAVVNSATQLAEKSAQNISNTYAKRTPMVTFIDDDGNLECYTDLLPIFKAHSVPLVSAYMGDSNPNMESNSAMMTKDQCREIVQAGGEIVVHYNPDLTTLTLSEAEDTVLKSKRYLAKNGFESRILVYSNGTSNSDIRAMASKHFDCAFSGAYPRVSNTDRSNHDCIVQYAIHREPCGGLYYDASPETRSLQYFKDMIDECISANGWLVFTLHSWLMPEGKRREEYDDTDQLGLLEDIIEYIEELQAGGSAIKVVTASEGLQVFGNAFQAGDYLGYWNEQTLTNTPTLGDHTQAGVAINKEGKFDFPSGNAY